MTDWLTARKQDHALIHHESTLQMRSLRLRARQQRGAGAVLRAAVPGPRRPGRHSTGAPKAEGRRGPSLSIPGSMEQAGGRR